MTNNKHKRMKLLHRVALALWLTVACVQLANAAPGARPSTQSAAEQLDRARQLAREGQIDLADSVFRSLLTSEDFDELTLRQRQLALRGAAAVALRLSDYPRALTLSRRSCETPQNASV